MAFNVAIALLTEQRIMTMKEETSASLVVPSFYVVFAALYLYNIFSAMFIFSGTRGPANNNIMTRSLFRDANTSQAAVPSDLRR